MWFGYLRISLLRVVRLFRGGNITEHHDLQHTGKKYLRDTIIPRQPPRLALREWTLPQRLEHVLSIDPAVRARVFSLTEKYASANPETLMYGLSKAEGHSAPAIYVKPGLVTRSADAEDWLIGDEIFHVHAEDTSLHVWWREADLKTVVSKGWGERFPLGALRVTHLGFGFVYAPRTMEECDIGEEIVRAGIEYITG